MQLVINIDDKLYEIIKNPKKLETMYHASRLCEAVRNGIPLPKGHGRIGDLDALERNMIGGIKAANFEEGYADYVYINNVDDCVDCVRYADAIIEADKEDDNV